MEPELDVPIQCASTILFSMEILEYLFLFKYIRPASTISLEENESKVKL